MPKLRVGIVNFLNSKPLAWGFLKGHHAVLFAPSYHPPALVARMLGQGNRFGAHWRLRRCWTTDCGEKQGGGDAAGA